MKCNYTAAADESGSRVVRERSMHKRVRQHARSIPVRSLSMQAAKLLPLTITAGSGGAALMVPHPYHGNSHPFSLGWLPVAAFGFIGTGLGCGYSRRRRYLFFVGCVLAGLIFQAACGGGSNSSKSVNYAITITGTSGSTQHSTSVTLTVQ